MLIAFESGPRPELPGQGSYLSVYRYDAATHEWVFGNVAVPGQPPIYFLPGTDTSQLFQYAAAVNNAGRLVVAWTEVPAQVVNTPVRRRVRLAHYSPQSRKWTVVADSVDVPGSITEDTSPGWQSFHVQALLDDQGHALIAWKQVRVVDQDVQDVQTRRFDVNADAFEAAPVQVSSGAGTVDSLTLCLNPLGGALVLWAERELDNVSNSLKWSRYDPVAHGFSAPGLVEDSKANVGFVPAGIAFAPDGKAIAVWEQAGNIQFNRYS
jgi:hypothetical protein